MFRVHHDGSCAYNHVSDRVHLDLKVECQQWNLDGRRPALRCMQELTISIADSHWLLYDLPHTAKTFGRPPVVALSSNLEVLRLGSLIFTKDEKGRYQLAANVETSSIFIDEFAKHQQYVAVTTRRRFPVEELLKQRLRLNEEVKTVESEYSVPEDGKGVLLLDQVLGVYTSPSTIEVLEETQTDTDDSSSETTETTEFEKEVVGDILIEDPRKFSYFPRDLHMMAEALESTDSSNQSCSDVSENSAEEDWTDGSSEMLSDEVEDDDQWNDWGSQSITFEELTLENMGKVENMSAKGLHDEEQVPGFDDLESLESQADDMHFDEVWTSAEGDEIKISGFTLRKGDIGYESDSSEHEASSVPTSNSEDEHSSQASEEDDEDKQRVSIRVQDIDASGGTLKFHFTRYVKRSIFDSPAVFHPSRPLLVWPLGDSEILFADYKANTFFTRMLSCSRFGSSSVFVKAHFSSSGEYIHFAVLEALAKDPKPGFKKGSLLLSLQVSTHRLSIRKPTRSPPRLIYRTTIDLGEVATLNVSLSPYTLSWTEQLLYLTTRAETLNVMRIPLFQARETTDTDNTPNEVCYVQGDVYLPRTTASRTLHFFPAPTPPSTATTSTAAPIAPPARTKTSTTIPPPTAKIIIGAHSAIPSQALLVPAYQVSPPITVLLHEDKDLGGWKPKDGADAAADGKQQRGLNTSGGRLQGKFETFDWDKDCDIVPFLY